MVAFIVVEFLFCARWTELGISENINSKKTLTVSCFCLIKQEKIGGANITSTTKQLDWFSANERRYAWRGNQISKTYGVSFVYRSLHMFQNNIYD